MSSMGSAILVTGAAGFMGSWLCEYLLEEGYVVWGVDNLSDGSLENVDDFNRFGAFWNFIELELSDPIAVQGFAEGAPYFDVVYHLAADATEGRSQFTPVGCTNDNLLSYVHILRYLLHNASFGRMVCTTSMSVYGEQELPFDESAPRIPIDVYGWNKAAMEGVTEALADVYDFEYCILRPHNVMGPRQSRRNPYRNVLAIWINMLMRGKHPWIYGDGEQTRAFSYIENMIKPFADSGFLPEANGEIINLGGLKEYSINEAAQIVCEEFFAPEPVPEWAIPHHLEDRPREVKHAYTTYEKSVDILGYQETHDLREGVRRMIDWMKEVGPVEPEYTPLEITCEKTPKAWTEKLI